ncbi:hypothetical protein MNBD_NITROSPINAE01-97 [hydrothermal vent metagenome]|uniref:SPOR domain-containing protein n=1 Tax=hydrothermal vent metagenome TaxID=652676 RepID=A0A3B1BYD4_9ZZZZ
MNTTPISRHNLVLAAFLILFSSVIAIAQHNKPLFNEDTEDEKQPLEVTSERMISDKKNNVITFIGSVVAIKGKLRVEADLMKIFTEEGREDFRELEATGSVKITHLDKIATGKKANYYPDQRKIVLTGSPELIRGKDKATGEKVVYYFESEDMEIFGGEKKRSTVILYPSKKNKEPVKKGTKKITEPEQKLKKPSAPPETKVENQPTKDGKSVMYTVQVGSYTDKKEALALKKMVTDKGYNAYIKEFAKGKVTWYRVRIGQFRTSAAATRVARDIAKKEELPTIVLHY